MVHYKCSITGCTQQGRGGRNSKCVKHGGITPLCCNDGCTKTRARGCYCRRHFLLWSKKKRIELAHAEQPVVKETKQHDELPSSELLSSSSRLVGLDTQKLIAESSSESRQKRKSQRLLEQTTQKKKSHRLSKEQIKRAKLNVMKSFIVPDVHRIEKELILHVSKVLSSIFMYPFRTPWEGGAKGAVITFDSVYGSKPTNCAKKIPYLKQSYSKQCKDDGLKTVLAPIYGSGTGSTTFGIPSTQRCCREMSASMLSICNIVEKLMKKYLGDDNTVNTNVDLNTCELICYYDDKRIRYHRDMTYTKNGDYNLKSNSQIESTAVCILVIGDTRELLFRLHDYDNKAYGDVITMPLMHGCVLFLHPNDERDVLRWISSEQEYVHTHYRHCSEGVAGDKNLFSIGFVFRACHTTHLVDTQTGAFSPTRRDSSRKCLDCDKALKEYFSPSKNEEREADENSLMQLFIRLNENYLE